MSTLPGEFSKKESAVNSRRTFLKSIPVLGTGAIVMSACATSGVQPTPTEADQTVDLWYSDTGTGEPIVFVPGFTFSSEVFDAQVAFFAKTNRVIVIDPRSHGRSPVTQVGNSYPQHGRDLARLFDKLNLQNVTLVGWSFGALSAWSYVDKFGLDRISRFVCIDMPPVPLSGDEGAGNWVELPIDQLPGAYQALSSEDGQSAFISAYANAIMVQRQLSDEELEWIVSLSMNTPPIIAQQLFASGCFSNYLATAERIESAVPSLFVIAEHWSNVATPYLRNVLPQSHVETLGGHMMFWEFPREFNAIIESFMRR